MVESCRFESHAGLSGEVTVVLSLAYEATLQWENSLSRVRHFC